MTSIVRGIGLAAILGAQPAAYAAADEQRSPDVGASAVQVAAAAPQTGASAADVEAGQTVAQLEEIVVIGSAKTYATTRTTQPMLDAQSPVASALDVIDDLPGVLVTEGDPYGFDDWSTTVTIRGFSLDLGQQQIGTTIDGLPNGNSNYGGGAKVNRYIDTPNLAGAEVSQGTADIASRSHEALGGTINFMTGDPLGTERFRVLYSAGNYEAQKYYLRYDTPEWFGNTAAWVSASSQTSTDFINASAEQRRDHAAAKFISQLGETRLTGYLSYDDVHEDNYQSVTPQEFRDDPTWDRLTAEWVGIPYIDQLYRKAWSTLRENTFAYLRAERSLFSGFDLNGAAYYHHNKGRGDWVPPYLVDIIADGSDPESELDPDTRVGGGAPLGRIYYVDAAGVALSPDPNCQSSITFPYGGAGPEYDPACYPAGAVPVQSYRHTNYAKDRYGFTGDFAYAATFGAIDNTLRGGVWYELSDRDEWRTWHRLLDARVGPYFDHSEYWRQYDRSYPTTTTMYYVEDALNLGALTLRGGVKQFFVDLERKDNFQNGATTASVNSDSDALFSGGAVYQLPVDGLEVFAGYAQNFAAIKDSVLESDATALERIEPEQADNVDVGLRYARRRLSASLTAYQITFDNRIVFVSPTAAGAPDYLNETNGAYLNYGGVESTGVELAGDYRLTDHVRLYASYTNNDSTYTGTGDPALDDSLGIEVGNTVFGSVEQQFVVSADLRNQRYFGGASYKWVGDRWLDPTNTQRLDSFGLLDLYAGVHGESISDALRGYELRLNVINALDESYLGGADGGAYAWIGTPRTAVLSVTADF